MNDKQLFGRLIVFAIINVVIVYILEQYNRKVAMLYVIVLFMLAMYKYKDDIFPAINIMIGTIKGITENG